MEGPCVNLPAHLHQQLQQLALIGAGIAHGAVGLPGAMRGLRACPGDPKRERVQQHPLAPARPPVTHLQVLAAAAKVVVSILRCAPRMKRSQKCG